MPGRRFAPARHVSREASQQNTPLPSIRTTSQRSERGSRAGHRRVRQRIWHREASGAEEPGTHRGRRLTKWRRQDTGGTKYDSRPRRCLDRDTASHAAAVAALRVVRRAMFRPGTVAMILGPPANDLTAGARRATSRCGANARGWSWADYFAARHGDCLVSPDADTPFARPGFQLTQMGSSTDIVKDDLFSLKQRCNQI